MEDLCGHDINMDSDGIHTAIVQFIGYVEPKECLISVSPAYYWNKLSFQVKKYSNQGDSCLMFSQKLPGRKDTEQIPGLLGMFCDYNSPPLHRQFTMEKLYVSYMPQSIQYYSDITFDIIVTVFRENGSCDEYECDNGRCIPNDLQCSAYNPCGDSSDCPISQSKEKGSSSLGKIISIIAAILAGIVVMLYAVKRMSTVYGPAEDRDSDVRDEQVGSEVQPFSEENGTAGLTYNLGDFTNLHQHFSQDDINRSIRGSISGRSDSIRTSPSLNPTPSPVCPGEMHRPSDEINLHEAGMNGDVGNTIEVDINGDRETNNGQLPPPSYEEVMANETVYKITH